MSPDKHIPEETLVEFLLQDSADTLQIRAHLDRCPTCAARSAAIAETLRIFSADPVPLADVESHWHLLRPHLQPQGSGSRRRSPRSIWLWPAFAVGMAVVILVALGSWQLRHPRPRVFPATTLQPSQPLPAPASGQDTAVQLASAERLLTALSHLSGPLDPDTRVQAHALLLRNAGYARRARAHAEPGEALVLENLGRVLTSVGAAPPTSRATLQFQKEWDIAGLLLELRLLQQDRLAYPPRPIEDYR